MPDSIDLHALIADAVHRQLDEDFDAHFARALSSLCSGCRVTLGLLQRPPPASVPATGPAAPPVSTDVTACPVCAGAHRHARRNGPPPGSLHGEEVK